jgi:hypothetical protein
MLNLLNLVTTLNKLNPFLVIQNELICNTHESKPKNIKHECKHKHHVKMKTCTNIKKTCKTYHTMFWNFKSPKKYLKSQNLGFMVIHKLFEPIQI